ncbi:hypothetical protein KM043_011132 [Ampulex compressa]|nr:hypothetical protein KM043_011132 [Ampulex compressa]
MSETYPVVKSELAVRLGFNGPLERPKLVEIRATVPLLGRRHRSEPELRVGPRLRAGLQSKSSRQIAAVQNAPNVLEDGGGAWQTAMSSEAAASGRWDEKKSGDRGVERMNDVRFSPNSKAKETVCERLNDGDADEGDLGLLFLLVLKPSRRI